MTRLKVGLIVPGFSANESDWCIPALLNVVRELAKQHEVHVFTLRYPHRKDTYQVFGATVHAFGGAFSAGTSRLKLLGKALIAIIRHQRRHGLDILHGIWADEPGFLAVAAGRLTRTPAIVSIFGGELVGLQDIDYGVQLSHVGRWLVNMSLRSASTVTVGSKYLADLAKNHMSQDRLILMPIGVDTKLFHPSQTSNNVPLSQGKFKLLHVASQSAVKDHETLFMAVTELIKHIPRIHLHLVGSTTRLNKLEQLTISLRLENHVTFHGEVRHNHLPAYYRSADLCVQSSRFESQSMAMLEAAACGRATIGTAVGILPELVPACRLVPIRDADSLSKSLIGIIENPQMLSNLEQSSFNAVQTRYTLQHTVDTLTSLYERWVY